MAPPVVNAATPPRRCEALAKALAATAKTAAKMATNAMASTSRCMESRTPFVVLALTYGIATALASAGTRETCVEQQKPQVRVICNFAFLYQCFVGFFAENFRCFAPDL